MFSMQSIFHHFLNNTWHYQSHNTDRALALLSESEKREFRIDERSFKWDSAFYNHIFGLRRFYLKEDVPPPEAKMKQLLQKVNPGWFLDVRTALDASKNVISANNTIYFRDILRADSFNAYVKSLTKLCGQTDQQVVRQPSNVKSNQRFLDQRGPVVPYDVVAAQKQLEEMSTSISPNGVRLALWYFNKNMRRTSQGLFIDTQSVEMVKNLVAQNQKVILLPLYKSYVDFFIQMYVMNTQKIPMGYTFGNLEDTPRIALIDKLLKSCGYITSRRKPNQSLQSRYLNSEMLNQLITNNQVVTVYQNEERFRAGKLNSK